MPRTTAPKQLDRTRFQPEEIGDCLAAWCRGAEHLGKQRIGENEEDIERSNHPDRDQEAAGEESGEPDKAGQQCRYNTDDKNPAAGSQPSRAADIVLRCLTASDTNEEMTEDRGYRDRKERAGGNRQRHRRHDRLLHNVDKNARAQHACGPDQMARYQLRDVFADGEQPACRRLGREQPNHNAPPEGRDPDRRGQSEANMFNAVRHQPERIDNQHRGRDRGRRGQCNAK